MASLIDLFPGQGSQRIGMAGDFMTAGTAGARMAARADEILDRPLSRLITRGPLVELTRTENQQPALCLAGALARAAADEAGVPRPVACAGHSLGELTACYASGAFDFETLIRLAAARGALMADAAARVPGGMVMLHTHDATVLETVRVSAGLAGSLVVAGMNAPDETVLSGAAAACAAARDAAERTGVRASALNAGGPWHSPAMALAAEAFAAVLDTTPFFQPHVPVFSCADGRLLCDAAALKSRLARQIVEPVDWRATTRVMRAAYPEARFIEFGSGKVLTGLALRNDPTTDIKRVDDASSLVAAVRWLSSEAAVS